MIDLNLTPAPQVVETLDKSPFKFYLTGSRLFGGKRAGSDFDYVVQDNPAVEQLLQQAGFLQMRYTFYTTDCDVRVVYRHLSKDGQVDVQLVGDIKHRLQIQEALRDTDALYGLSKDRRARVWRAMYRASPPRTSMAMVINGRTINGPPLASSCSPAAAVKRIKEMRAERASLTCTCGADQCRDTMGCHQSYCDLVTGVKSV